MTGQFDLSGRVALVSGASSGIGRGLALGLARAGADLALAARRGGLLGTCAAEIRALERQAEVIPSDVSTVAGAQHIVQECLARFGRVDVLVNAAGITRRKPALEITEDDWDTVLDTNLRSAFFTSQAAARSMIAQGGGKIINVVSLTSVIGILNIAAYGASKGGLAQLTRALAVEWAQQNIQVNAIGPGYIETPLTQPLFDDPERSAWIHSRIPVGRRGYPEDLVGAAVFLASSASDYVTGQLLFVDGGWLAG